MHAPDILIAGAGPAGLACALALQAEGFDVGVVGAREREAVERDPRALALAYGSRQILERLGVWHALDATPIRRIHVSQQAGFGRCVLRAEELGVPALGYVVRAGTLARRLRERLEERGVQPLDGLRVGPDTQATEDGVAFSLFADGDTPHTTCTARLLVRAEGAVEPDAVGVRRRNYGQQALIANVEPLQAHDGQAFERFTADGPLALLPHGTHYAMVHVVAGDRAAALLGLDDARYIDHLEALLGRRLSFRSVSPRHAWPLELRVRREPAAARTVWLGNAAQTLHPVAGQGFNLALRDIWQLARGLREHADDPGTTAALAAYARDRRLDRSGTIGFTDGLIRLFSNDIGPLHHARGAGLFLLDVCSPLKGFLARRMMFGARAWP